MVNQTDEKIVLSLDIPKSASSINADIKKLQKQLKQLKITGALDNNTNVKQLNNQIAKLQTQLEDITISTNIETNLDTKETGKLTNAINEQLKLAGDSVKHVFSLGAAVTFGFTQMGKAVTELKNLDSILTQIGTNSDLTKKQLISLGDSSFQIASKYGKNARDYLTSVREMTHAGYKNPGEMSELSMLTQSAGNVDATTADNYLIASDAAYELKGNIEALNKVVDGQNNITNNAATSMTAMAQATLESASIAAQYGVKINELSALIATANSITNESGSETGSALKELFTNLQNTSSQPIKETLDSVNVSMTKMVNGSETLKTPIQLLEELSSVYAGLEKGDARRSNILSNIGGADHANTLSAILGDWSSYEQMLDLYSQGMGSAAVNAQKTADSWEGSLNKLSNTWTDTMGNIANSEVMTSAVNGLNGVLSALNKVTDFLGSAGTIGAGIGLFAGVQNTGKTIQVYGYQNNCFEYALHA